MHGNWRDHDDVIKWKHVRVTGHLCGEFTGHRWIPHTKAIDAELWCFLWSALNKRLIKPWWGWWFETPSCPLWRHCIDRTRAIRPFSNCKSITQRLMSMHIAHACIYRTLHTHVMYFMLAFTFHAAYDNPTLPLLPDYMWLLPFCHHMQFLSTHHHLYCSYIDPSYVCIR